MSKETESRGNKDGTAPLGARKASGDSTGVVTTLGRDRGAPSKLGQVFARLDAVLEAERSALLQGRMADIEEITRRKSQCLLDLTRFSRAVDVEVLAAREGKEQFTRELMHLKEKLADNEAMLKRYVEAAREVASLVAEGLRASESDGTYTEAGPFGRYGR